MDRASTVILVVFLVSIALFGALVARLVGDDARRADQVPIRKAPATVGGVPADHWALQTRIRLGVVAVSFFIWSLLVSEHLRHRR